MVPSIVLLQCGQRSGHFGQGTFTASLVPHFQNSREVDLTIVQTDTPGISQPQTAVKDGIKTISIPPLIGPRTLTAESVPEQQFYAAQLTGILYSHLRQKQFVVLWVNTIDYLNVATELRKVLPDMRMFYVHHSFTWKYLLNISDEHFKFLWKENQAAIPPKAVEMTGYQQKMALLADQLITVTDHAKNFFIDVLDVPAEKVRVIYNGGAPAPVEPLQKSVLRKKYGFQEEDKILVICGRITRDKGVPDTLRAFRILAEKYENLKLVVIGTGYMADFVQLAAPYWNRVVYTGEIERTQVIEFYQMADIGLMPSFHEQCSFTAIEMQLNGLPLIVSAVDGLDEMFTDGDDALKLPLNIDSSGYKRIETSTFADKIETLLTDPMLRKRLAKNALSKAKRRYSLATMQSEYDRLISDLCQIAQPENV